MNYISQQLGQYLSGASLTTADGLGHSGEKLGRKFRGQIRRLMLQMGEFENFKTIRNEVILLIWLSLLTYWIPQSSISNKKNGKKSLVMRYFTGNLRESCRRKCLFNISVRCLKIQMKKMWNS